VARRQQRLPVLPSAVASRCSTCNETDGQKLGNVSFYKGLRALGAAVAGPEEVIAEVRLWGSRHAGTLWTMLPTRVATLSGLRDELPRMAEYHDRALEMAELLAAKGFPLSPSARTATSYASSLRHPPTSSTSGSSL
jgi:threonine aldolase